MHLIFLLWLLLVSAITFCQAGKKDGEIVYPERIHSWRPKRDLSTEIKEKEHEDTMTVKINSKRGDIIIDLKKNTNLYPGNMVLRTYGSDGIAKHDNIQPTNCHYDGTVRDKVDSYAFISTCRGLVGSIDTGEKRYDLEPSGPEGAHLLYPVDDVLNRLWEKLSHDLPIPEVSKKTAIPYVNGTKKQDIPTEFKAGIKVTTITEAAKKSRKFRMEGVEEAYQRHFTVDYPRYVEMFVSVGDKVVDKYEKDTDLIIERVLNSIGAVNKAYQAINIWVSVVGMEIQTNGPSMPRSDPTVYLTDLESFRDHIAKIRNEPGLQDIRIDNAQLLSHLGDVGGEVIGLAYVGKMCNKPDSVAINKWNYESIAGNSYVLAHEMGHNLNFKHDDEHCKCLSRRGCFMPPIIQSISRPGFSDCNMRQLGEKVFACMNDLPKNTITSQCGNGIIEKDEECDCGTPENCRKVDPCCQPTGCKLKAESQCSALQGKCCTEQCQFQRQGTMCRESLSNCDRPEYCTGEAGTCPADKYAANGTPCGESKTMIKGNDDSGTIVNRELTPRVEGRYFKVIPKHWKKNAKACMQLELQGCDTGEDSASRTTTISAPLLKIMGYQIRCMASEVDNCEDVKDGTKLRFKVASDIFGCTEETMKFDYHADGTLIHHCSKKKVCRPSTPVRTLEDVALILSDQCDDDSTKFDREDDWVIKHRKSGYCLSTAAHGAALDEDVIVYEWACQEDKRAYNAYFFQDIDCAKPMGITNGKISNSSMKSGPYMAYRNDIGLEAIRMSETLPFCAEDEKDGGWFQVDMGKEVEIRYITIKGNSHEKLGVVTGFNLMYSKDGKAWKYYQESGLESKGSNSHCYQGACAMTLNHQCRKIWGAGAKSADMACWSGLNTGSDGYGTCSATEVKACSPSNVKCGQLQCSSLREEPYYAEDYGKDYALKLIDGHNCSAAKIVGANDELGLGMVEEGSQCGVGKICLGQKCTVLPDIGCHVDGKICNEKGVCLNDGTCLCEGGYDPDTNCVDLMEPVDGSWSDWAGWSECNKACGGGKSKRSRFCTNPSPKFGGEGCEGDQVEEKDCNQEECPVDSSCRTIQSALNKAGKNPHDGVYTIEVEGTSLDVYCDMTRDGGGWTLLVSTHTNTWTADNVKLRNENAPQMSKDYSILEHGNAIKDSYRVKDGKFQFRLEANNPGEWGGIWEAPQRYDVASTNDKQIEGVELKKKFSDWEYNGHGLERRVPYIDGGVRITMGMKGRHWGCVTDNKPEYHPVRWIQGKQKLELPTAVWYWIREGELAYPKTCLELYFRGLKTDLITRKPLPSGVYEIGPAEDTVVETYCDMDRHGGGWTLLVNSAGEGWEGENVKMRNEKDASAEEYSIFGLLESIVEVERGETSYNMMIEADLEDKNGGIFEIPLGEDGKADSSLKPIVVQKFGNWDDKKENIGQFQITIGDGQLAATDVKPATSGVIVSEEGGKYMSKLQKPSKIKVWLREGGSRHSCNDIRVNGKQTEDGLYMTKNNVPVYCDMTTTPGEGWTLIVTAATKGWTEAQAESRNTLRPSMFHDYSILNVADTIKSVSKASHFKYMLTASTHPNWGGIWRAPKEYSFVSTDKSQTDVELLHQFGKWSYDVKWFLGPCRRMPYLQKTRTSGSAILMTVSQPAPQEDQVWELGTIISTDATPPTDKPSQWINTEMQSPGFIWYWVNENESAGTVNRKTTLLREKGRCWEECQLDDGPQRESGGTCKKCGPNGYCCRKGASSCIKRFQDVADPNDHYCVKDEPKSNEPVGPQHGLSLGPPGKISV